jgi:hypothetical protein
MGSLGEILVNGEEKQPEAGTAREVRGRSKIK